MVRTTICWIIIALAAAVLAASAAGQTQPSWRPARGMVSRFFHSAAFDPVRESVMVFGGVANSGTPWFTDPNGRVLDGTFAWDGNSWTQLVPAASPPRRYGHAMATDHARHRVVLFGGRNEVALFRDTWEWDGATWTQRLPPTIPALRYYHAMASDPIRDRVVLWGGYAAGFNYDDTWEWNGTDWSKQFTLLKPPPARHAAIAFDPTSQEMILFGGLGLGTDTWSWDGTTWTLRNPANRPAARSRHAMVTDWSRGRVVLISDHANLTYPASLPEHWEWDGTNWNGPFSSAFGMFAGAAAYDTVRQRLVVGGGRFSPLHQASNETWEHDGTQWQQQDAGDPPARHGAGFAEDAIGGNVVMFGGRAPNNGPYLAGTWSHDGLRWRAHASPQSPTVRYEPAMTRDHPRDRVLLFGGHDGFGSSFADTWEWDGSAWQLRTPTTSPPRRGGHVMAFDQVRQRVVLFGGKHWSTFFGDFWEWTGSNWQAIPATPAPSPRRNPFFASDPLRQVVVLFGGQGVGFQSLADTWEWNGATWTQLTPTTQPTARYSATGSYDPTRQVVVLHGGSASGWPSDVWSWNGANWTQLLASSPFDSRNTQTVFHHASQRLFSFGAGDDKRYWFLAEHVAASVQTAGTGCPGAATIPALTATEPFLGNSSQLFDLTTERPHAPCIFGFSLAQQNLQLGNGCVLHLQQPLLLGAVTNLAGHAQVRTSIPPLLALRGLQVYAQGAVFTWLGTTPDLALSRALRLTLGD